MLLTKIKGIALGLAAAAVVTTGVSVLAQHAGNEPTAQDDRLGAVEKKLDRILEALGSTRRDDRGEASPFEKDGPAMKSRYGGTADYGKTAGSPGPSVSGAMRGTRSDMAPPQGYSGMMSSMMQDQMQNQMKGMRGMMGGMMQMQPAIESRIAELERRLDDLERRFGQMEHRLSEVDRPDAGSAAQPRRRMFDAQKK